MIPIRTTLALVVLLSSAVGCAGSASDDQTPSPIELQDDFGGRDGLLVFFSTTSDSEIREVLATYGIGFVTHARDEDDGALPAALDRSTWHAFGGAYHYVEADGRTTTVLGRSALGNGARGVSFGLPLCVANRCWR